MGIGSIRKPLEKTVPWYYLGQACDDPIINENFEITGFIPAIPIEEAMVNLEHALEDAESMMDKTNKRG